MTVTKTIWMYDWQWQCCGEPFQVGSHISWALVPLDLTFLATILGEEAASSVTQAEEHHDLPENAPRTSGRVTAIRAMYCRLAPLTGGDPRDLYLVEGSGIVESRTSATDGSRRARAYRFRATSSTSTWCEPCPALGSGGTWGGATPWFFLAASITMW